MDQTNRKKLAQEFGTSLCLHCRTGQVIRGHLAREMITICHLPYPSVKVPFPVYECTDFADKRHAKLSEMEELALRIEPNSSGRKAGFAIPESSPEAELKKTVLLPLNNEETD